VINDRTPEVLIPRTSAAILDLLLRAGLCTPRYWEESMRTLGAIERDETLDALSQQALPLPQLTWEWAGTHGNVPLLHHKDEYTLDTEAFNEDLMGLTTNFSIQVSVAYNEEHHEDIGAMPPFRGQRVKLTNRTSWITIGPPPELTTVETEELNRTDEAADDDAVPHLFAPALRLGRTRAGETWVRIHPDQLLALQQEPYDLILLLAIVSEEHMNHVRAIVRDQALQYENNADELAHLLRRMSGWQELTRTALDALNTLTPEQQRERAPGILHIITRNEEPPSANTADARSRQLRKLLRELDEITNHPDANQLAHRVYRWHDRATSYVNTAISTNAAADLRALRSTSPDGGASTMRYALLALQADLNLHPEEYPTPREAPHDLRKAALQWLWQLPQGIRIAVGIILLLGVIGVGTWRYLLPDATKERLLATWISATSTTKRP
jgi:hypothetical protein